MLARHLAFCATEIEQHITTATMDHAKLRAKVHEYFRAQLEDAKARMSRQGPITQDQRASYKTMLSLMEEGNHTYWHTLGSKFARAELDDFFRATGLPREQYRDVTPIVLDQIRKARIGAYRAVLTHAEGLDTYDFTEALSGSHSASQGASAASAYPTIRVTVDAFFREHEKTSDWRPATFKKRRAALEVAIEWFGPDTHMSEIGKPEATEFKEALLALPANRSKVAALRGLTLREAVAMSGLPTISNGTINAYLSVYRIFWEWAEQHGRAPAVLFKGMSVSKNGRGKKDTRPFAQEALEKTYSALTDPGSKFYSKHSHKWATLIAMFTGARQNEVCQLLLSDISNIDGVWVFDFNDEEEDTKRLKSKAARRRVPMQSHLIELGLLKYIEVQRAEGQEQLFPDYDFHPDHGYGGKVSKWSNRTFTETLGIKSEAHTFHGLRHTFITRLEQADVPHDRVQFIVGHEREGVTHQVYNKEGFTIRQTKDAVERYAIHSEHLQT